MDFGLVVHSAPAVPMGMRLNARSHTLPALRAHAPTTPRLIPRRYEETRPALVQDFSHKRILSLGLDVHHRLQQQAETKREEAVRETEGRIWMIAEEQKSKALEELRKQLALQAEQQLQRFKRMHQQELQEKLLEVETALRQEMRDAIDREKEEARQRLEAALAENDKRWEAVVLQEVASARLEEVQKATAEKAELRRQHEAEIRALIQEAKADKAAALQALEQRKNTEAAAAVAAARREEKAAAASLAARVREQHAEELAALKSEIGAREQRLSALERDLAAAETAKSAVEDALLERQARFNELVHRVFREDRRLGQAEFLNAEDAEVLAILTERGVEAGSLRGEAWRPHSPDTGGLTVASVSLPRAQLPPDVKIRDDFL